MTFPFGETVTLIRRSVTSQDALGNDVETATETAATGAAFDPGGSTENVQGQDQVISTPRFIWVGTTPALHAVDAIRRQDGTVWEITGDPLGFTSPFNGQQVLEVHVRKVAG